MPGTTPEAARRQARAALWLLRNGIPTARALGFPVFDKFTSLSRRIAALPPTVLTRQQQLRLRELLDTARTRGNTVPWPTRPCVIHGYDGDRPLAPALPTTPLKARGRVR
ncbi:hypothetical protein [Kitasatospora purpeofusca]|uniref:hypothetical protein n=1 Tax=Kitasatospora purpeofusca TaxID=67352 RepID=UPI0036D3831A